MSSRIDQGPKITAMAVCCSRQACADERPKATPPLGHPASRFGS